VTLVTKIEPIDDWIAVTVAEGLSPAAQSRTIAVFAREKIVETSAANARVLGSVPPRTTFVDGREGASLDSVRPTGGVIATEWELVGPVLAWIGKTLAARSPVVTGGYRAGHRLFADGNEIEIDSKEFPAAHEYVFMNLVPYARKIEIGRTQSGRAFVVQVPNRIYERTAADAAARFGALATIVFDFLPAPGATSRRAANQSRAPAIIVR
jgi:hypothetical protein